MEYHLRKERSVWTAWLFCSKTSYDVVKCQNCLPITYLMQILYKTQPFICLRISSHYTRIHCRHEIIVPDNSSHYAVVTFYIYFWFSSTVIHSEVVFFCLEYIKHAYSSSSAPNGMPIYSPRRRFDEEKKKHLPEHISTPYLTSRFWGFRRWSL